MRIRTQLMRRLLILGVTTMSIVVGVFAASSLQTVTADIGDEDAHVGFLGGEEDENGRGPKWITRNLVDGTAIEVCSKDYPVALGIAVSRWEQALGIDAFDIKKQCNTDPLDKGDSWDPREGAVSLTLSMGEWVDDKEEKYEGDVIDGECPASALGCTGFDKMSRQTSDNTAWQSYHGRAEIMMNPDSYSHDYDPERPTNVIRDIAHEMGHILALADYFCHDPDATSHDVSEHPDRLEADPETGMHTRTLMNSFTARSECNALGDVPSEKDKSDYRIVYLPEAVTKVMGGANHQLVTLTWDPSNVFVESGFEIQRENGDAWELVAKAEPNETFVHFSGRQVEKHKYRVVSRTMAIPIKETDTDFGYSDDETASDVVSVTVKMSRPANPDVTGRSTTSLTLVWVEVDAADGYDVRYDVRIIETARIDCEAPPDEEEMVRGSPYTFTGLSASTAYLLCVRATLSSNPDATSNWASISRTTQAPPQPQPQPPPPPPTGVECLSSTDPEILVAVDNDCVTIRASRMLIDLHGEGHDEICGILMWDGTHWHRYAIVNEVLIPGSEDYTILGGAVLWLIDCGSARADGTWPSPPVPTAEELKRLARLAAK